MKWQGRRESENVEDRRGIGGKQIAAGGGGLALIILIIGFLMGGDPQKLLSDFQQSNQQTQATTSNGEVEESAEEKAMSSFMKVTLADNERIWDSIFTANQMQYQKPVLVLFRNLTNSPCGDATSQSGPFYCPGDQKIYIDMSFFDELTSRLGAHGDFASAYVLSHEVAHHIQYLLGTTRKIQGMQQQSEKKEANRLSVALELQADFYAGVWAHYNHQMLEDGDIEEALSAANAVGDDRLQKQAQGYVVPDAFTHGTSEQRMYWFKLGYETGDMSKGNTFKGVL